MIKLRILGSEIGANLAEAARGCKGSFARESPRVGEISDIYGESLSCGAELTLINVSVLFDLKSPQEYPLNFQAR